MMPIHSLLTMTPESSTSPADEKPSPTDTTDSQEYAEAQGPTPPGDFNNQQPQQQNGGIAFNNPFPQSGQQQITQQAASQNQHPQQAEQPVRYSFNGGYQNGEQGYFQPQPAHRNSSNDSTPGTPGPNRVPIPRNSSASLSTPANSGPMSSTVTVPARPKPGRKPIVQDEANSADRRRMQNRNAQRNFRDRRQQKLSEMATEMDEARKDSLAKQAEWRAESENLHRQIRELKAQVAHLQHENGRMQEKLAQAETRRDTTAEVGMGGYPSLSQGPQTGHKRVRTDERTGPTSSSPPGAPAQVSPTTRTASPLEQDFTSRPAPRPMGQWRPSSTAPTAAPAPPAALAPAESVTESPAQIMGLEGKSYDCGFCTDASNCQCRYQDAITANALVDMSRVDRNGDETEAES